MKRRNFIKNAAIPLAMAGTFTPMMTTPDMKKRPFVHHVYFWLKNAGNEADREKLVEGLGKLSKVPEIRFHHIGLPASTNRDVIERTYAVSWLCFFDNLEEEEIYQKHPIHLKFIADYSHLWSKVVVYDSVEHTQ